MCVSRKVEEIKLMLISTHIERVHVLVKDPSWDNVSKLVWPVADEQWFLIWNIWI